MYKVFIADDESWIVESLKASIEWAEYDFEVIGEAYNGIDAFDKIRQLVPDVVFTDIRMPGYNGLELIKKVNDLFMNVQFIVVSGYAEFEYAQKAMNYGAVGYCLKPFDELEVIDLLNKAKKALKASDNLLEMEILDWIETDDSEGRQRVSDMLARLGMKLDDGDRIQAVVSIGSGELIFPQWVNYVRIRPGTERKVYLIRYDNHCISKKEELLHILAGSQGISGDISSVGISEAVDGVENIYKAIETANIAAHQFFITSERSIFTYNPGNQGSFHGTLKQLDEAIRNKDLPIVQEQFDAVEKLFDLGECNIGQAFIIYNMIISFLYRADVKFSEEYLISYDQLIDLFNDVREMVKYLKSSVLDQLVTKVDKKPDPIRNETYTEISQYINNHFYQKITIQSLSEMYFVNPNYLSQMFKKNAGENFTDYITKLRIRHACDLLANTGMSVREVGEKAGYDDYFYFSKIFKKIIGKTPTKFRDEVQ